MLQDKLGGRDGEFVYRGQENADWQLRSGAVRRILSGSDKVELQKLIKGQEEGFHKDNLHYHERELIDNARLRGLHREADGRELKDLELLARLQHYGAATCLLDFTSRFDVALWFACQKVKGKDMDGTVFIVALDSVNTWNLGRIGSNNLDHKINEILRFEMVEIEENQPQLFKDVRSKFWYWHPEAFMARMLIQESRFLFGSEDIPVKEYLFSVPIKKTDKKKLLVELKRYCGLSRESIFPDIHGFATIHNHKTPFQGESVGDNWQAGVVKPPGKFKKKNIEDYRQEGIKKIQMEEYFDAVKNFDNIIKLNENDVDALLYRGVAMLQLRIQRQGLVQRPSQIELEMQDDNYFKRAIKDFDKVIELEQERAEAHYYRSIALRMLGKHNDARLGFERAQNLYRQQGDKRGTDLASLYLQKLNELQ